FLHDSIDLYTYNPLSNVYQKLTSNDDLIDYHLTAVIDPVRKKFVMLGGTQSWVYDISAGSSYARVALTTVGGDAIINSDSPGLAYDSVSGKIIAWSGGDAVYSLDVATNSWTTISSYRGGPGPAIPAGTFGRWRYSPASGVFVIVNYVDEDA